MAATPRKCSRSSPTPASTWMPLPINSRPKARSLSSTRGTSSWTSLRPRALRCRRQADVHGAHAGSNETKGRPMTKGITTDTVPTREDSERGDFEEQLHKMKTHPGFVAALDQSGGSTPHALRAYGIAESAWSNEAEMFALVHQMRTRIITSPRFNGERIIGAILFEDTMDRDIEGQPTADYLWNVKQVVPFLKVDQGLAAEKDGVQLMKPMPALAALLTKAKAKR